MYAEPQHDGRRGLGIANQMHTAISDSNDTLLQQHLGKLLAITVCFRQNGFVI